MTVEISQQTLSRQVVEAKTEWERKIRRNMKKREERERERERERQKEIDIYREKVRDKEAGGGEKE